VCGRSRRFRHRHHPRERWRIASSLFCTDHFELVCRSDHRLALAKRLALKDLAGERFIYQVRHSIVGRYLASKLPSRQTEHFMEVHQLATVIGMVRAGLGIAAIPELNLYHFHYADLVRRDLRLPGLERRIYLLQPRGQILSVAAQALWELMHQHKPDHTLKPTSTRASGNLAQQSSLGNAYRCTTSGQRQSSNASTSARHLAAIASRRSANGSKSLEARSRFTTPSIQIGAGDATRISVQLGSCMCSSLAMRPASTVSTRWQRAAMAGRA
jgi:hypothetical protein